MVEHAKQSAGREQRGGTQGGEAARAIDPHAPDSGTPGIASPAGGIHPEPPAQAVSHTGLADQPVGDSRLAGGKTPEEIRAYLQDMTFPTKKDDLIHAVRRSGASDDVIDAMHGLTATEYRSIDDVLRDFPRLAE